MPPVLVSKSVVECAVVESWTPRRSRPCPSSLDPDFEAERMHLSSPAAESPISVLESLAYQVELSVVLMDSELEEVLLVLFQRILLKVLDVQNIP